MRENSTNTAIIIGESGEDGNAKRKRSATAARLSKSRWRNTPEPDQIVRRLRTTVGTPGDDYTTRTDRRRCPRPLQKIVAVLGCYPTYRRNGGRKLSRSVASSVCFNVTSVARTCTRLLPLYKLLKHASRAHLCVPFRQNAFEIIKNKRPLLTFSVR